MITMGYFLNLFSPETYETFSQSNRDVSGFRIRQKPIAERINPGDRFICYMTKLSRWVGVLQVESKCFLDNTPLFSEDDPYVVRFKVSPLAWLEPDRSIPIREDRVWKKLSFTRGQDKNSSQWTGKIRASLAPFNDHDASFLEEIIVAQMNDGNTFPIDEDEYRKLATHKVRREDKVVTVSIPQDSAEDIELSPEKHPEVRESIRIQALLAGIGAKMGFTIWIPPHDRSAVFKEWKDAERPVIDLLPLNYNDTTLRTIEQIDLLWLKHRAIVRAFEVEHTTSIYSGLLRMADLLALQPNIDINLHIVAPISRRDKVLQEIQRPVFSLLGSRPLSESCTYLSYDSVIELSHQKHLAHLSDSVLDEYVLDEYAEEAE